MTPICSSNAIVSIHALAVWPSGCRTQPISCEKNAPLPYGRVSVFTAAPRTRAYVQMTLKIMNRISQAPPVCDP